jgi:8-oxo-dGTP diphosphatase
VLVVQRGKEPRKGQWSFPGGAVELGERIEQAARREVLEETGVSLLEVGSPFYATSAIFPPTYHYTIVHILALARAEAVAAAASDAADAKFVPIEEVSALRPQLDRLQAVLQRALAAWRDPLWAPSLEGPRE